MSIVPNVNGIPAYRLSVAWHLGEPEDISYTVEGPAAVSMNAGQAPGRAALPISFDGTGIDATMLSTGTQLVYEQPGYVTETGKSTGTLLQTSAIIHRFTAQQISVSDAFTAAAGTIHTSDTHTICGGTLPDQAGIGVNAAGFTFVVDPSVAAAVLDVDVNEDNVLHATQIITERMGSYVDPQRTQFVIDSGALGPTGAPSVRIGAMGSAPHLTFGTDSAPLLRASTAQAQTTDMCRSVTFRGGDAHHGMPTAGRITDLATHINGMALIGVYGGTGVGGVYYWPGDGSLYPMTQAMGVNGIWYDPVGTVYAATDVGVYSGSDNVLGTTAWPRLGAMGLKCARVQKYNGNIYALAEFVGTTERHVLLYTPGTRTGVGYNDWTQITSVPDLTDSAVMGDYCYCILRNTPGSLWVHQLSTGATGAMAISSSGAITGLDVVDSGISGTSGIVVRTTEGSAGIWWIPSTTGTPAATRMNTDNSLVDDYGAPVLVNSIRYNPAGVLSCSTGSAQSLLLAATSRGVFSCPPAGSGVDQGIANWQRTDGQSSIGDFNAVYASAYQANSYRDPLSGATRVYQPIYAVADTAFYYSYNGSVNWIDAFSEPLDAGPFFYQHYRVAGAWPALTDTQFSVSYNGQSFTLYRLLAGTGQFVYQLINPSAPASVTQHRSAEISEISAPALMSDVIASRILVDAMARFLCYTTAPQIIQQIDSRFDVLDTSNPLRTLRPCMQVGVTGEPLEYLIAPGLEPYALGVMAGTFYVLDHTVQYDRDADPSTITTTTRLGALLLTDRQDPMKIVADLLYAVSRIQTYRSKARH